MEFNVWKIDIHVIESKVRLYPGTYQKIYTSCSRNMSKMYEISGLFLDRRHFRLNNMNIIFSYIKFHYSIHLQFKFALSKKIQLNEIN
jgi:hypothetical protein